MKPAAKASHEYLKNAIVTASPAQLQMMLYDGAIRYSLRGKEALESKDYEGAFNGFERAQRIVLELNNGLRREVNPELVDQMSALYDFVYRRLIEANVRQDASAAADAIGILKHMRETWELVLTKLTQEAPPTRTKSPADQSTTAHDQENSSLSIEG